MNNKCFLVNDTLQNNQKRNMLAKENFTTAQQSTSIFPWFPKMS